MRQVASGLQVQRESLAWPVPSARRVQPGPLERKARRVWLAWQEPLGRKGQQVRPEQREQLEPRATLASVVQLARPVRQARKESKAWRGQLVQLVPRDLKAFKDRRA